MLEILQGDILSIEGFAFPVLVVSKDFFNRSEQIIGCPIFREAAADPLHISVSTEAIRGFVLCEQVKLLDLRRRGHKKVSAIRLAALIDIVDAIQGIFDYYPAN